MCIPTTIKPKPKFDEATHVCKLCSKCSGTGFYCMEVRNGRPWSATGFTCHGCGGRGWKVAWKRGAKKAFWDSVPVYDPKLQRAV